MCTFHIVHFWHANTVHFHQEDLTLSTYFQWSCFHDYIIKILMLPSFCITTEIDMTYQGSFNPLNA